MTPDLAATDPLHDPLKAALDRDGYAVVPDVFTPDEVDELRAGFERLIGLARTLPGTSDVGGARFVMQAQPFRLHRVVWCGGADPALERYGRDPRLARIAARALGRTDLVQIIHQAHFKLPGDEVTFPWHQDAVHRRYGTPEWTDVDGRGSFVEIAVAVDDATAGNGPLRVVPGTHRLGWVGVDPVTGEPPAGTFDPADAVDVELKAGSAAVFGPFLVHGSEANRSAVARRLFLNGFAVAGANGRVYPGCGLGRPVHVT
jgi:ectoine hydroxylase-related dioxygenase (phytanoyl-CoA dioxygenase family)